MRHSFLRWAKNVTISSASLSGTGVALCVPPCEIQNVDNQLKKRKKCARTVKCISEIEYRRVVYSVATHFTVSLNVDTFINNWKSKNSKNTLIDAMGCVQFLPF